MIEYCPIDDTPLDIRFCGSPSERAEFERMLERHARSLRHLRQTPGRTAASARWPEPTRSVVAPPARLVVDSGPEFTTVVLVCALAQLPS